MQNNDNEEAVILFFFHVFAELITSLWLYYGVFNRRVS